MITVERTSDPALLSALHEQAFSDGWDRSACADVLSMPGTLCWVALEDGQPVGFLVLRQAADEGEVITTGVCPRHRRRGVARQLFNHAIRAITGCERLFLEVSEENLAARSLYKELGFQEAGRRKGYYADGSDALVLVR